MLIEDSVLTREISIFIKGKPSYEKWSIYQWILESTEILEREYCVVINIYIVDSLDETPVVVVEDIVIDNIPFDEGYIIEILKKVLDKIIKNHCIESDLFE